MLAGVPRMLRRAPARAAPDACDAVEHDAGSSSNAWQGAVKQVRESSSFRRRHVVQALRAGMRTRKARKLRAHTRVRLASHLTIMLFNMALFVLDGQLRPRPEPTLLTIAARFWGRGH